MLSSSSSKESSRGENAMLILFRLNGAEGVDKPLLDRLLEGLKVPNNDTVESLLLCILLEGCRDDDGCCCCCCC